MYALIQDYDIKTQKLAEEMQDIELCGMKGSVNKIPVYIITEIIKRKKRPKAVILRYVNDSNSFLKSLFRCITNIVSLLLVKLLKIKLIWISHNVDKESKEFYPFLVKIRRKLVIKLSDKILVTDKLLIKHAVKMLKVDESKLDYITFGEPKTNENLDEKEIIHQKILKFIEENKKENTLIGFSVGNPNQKVLQPFYTDTLIKKAQEKEINLKIILGGPLGDFIKKHDESTYHKLINNPNVLFLDRKIKFNELYISQFIDFYWRVYDDYSVPFTVYNAVYYNKPILTMERGFLKEMIIEYNLGEVLTNDMSNIVDVVRGLKRDRASNYREFIESHNWSIGANQLYKAIMY